MSCIPLSKNEDILQFQRDCQPGNEENHIILFVAKYKTSYPLQLYYDKIPTKLSLYYR